MVYGILLAFGLAIAVTQFITGLCLSDNSIVCGSRFLKIKNVKKRGRFVKIQRGNSFIIGSLAAVLTALFAFGLMSVNMFIGIMVITLIVDKLFDSIFEYHQLSF